MSFIFSSQDKLRYEIIGDYPSPSFFEINEESGLISVKAPLKEDNLKSTDYQVSFNTYIELKSPKIS